MKKFNQFIKESRNTQWVKLGDIFIRKYGPFPSISFLNKKIENYIEDIYGPMGYIKFSNSTLNINGFNINIQLMINNYIIFKEFIAENNIKSASEFVNKLISSFDDVYHYNGEFFNKNTKHILKNTSKKGDKHEKVLFKEFKKFAKSKGMDVEILKPTAQEDVKGTDGYFIYKDRKYTIQVKPFNDLISQKNIYKAKSSGSLSINTNFLFLYNGDDFLFIKNKEESPIKIKSNFFVFDKNNVFHKSRPFFKL